jgi:hypothetical protein
VSCTSKSSAGIVFDIEFTMICSFKPGMRVCHQHHPVVHAAANLSLTTKPPPARRSIVAAAAASDPFGQLPQPIAEPVAYTKAFAAVVLRHLTESALDTAAEVSIQVAEAPKRMRQFAEEVQDAADRELKGFGQQQQRSLSSSSSASSGQGSGSNGSIMSNSASRPDLEALVDDLRADIAASRALLQQIRAGNTGSQAGTQSTRR